MLSMEPVPPRAKNKIQKKRLFDFYNSIILHWHNLSTDFLILHITLYIITEFTKYFLLILHIIGHLQSICRRPISAQEKSIAHL